MSDEKEKELILNFARCVAICHGAIPVLDKDGTSVLYESPSPDESALLYGLREDDALLVHRTKDAITISVFGKALEPFLSDDLYIYIYIYRC